MNERILEDLKLAMKNADKFKLSVLRLLKSAMQLESINQKKDLEDQDVIAVIKKQVKIRKDSIEEYKKYNKVELVESLQKEIEILNAYLPEEMSEEAIDELIDEIFKEMNPNGLKDMGNIMKELTSRIENADMTLVSKKVKERLMQI